MALSRGTQIFEPTFNGPGLMYRLTRSLLAIALAIPVALRAQVARDVIRGRVTSDSGTAVAAAQVIATRAPDRAIFRTTTDIDGRYTIAIDSGTGDYLVHISLPTQPTWAAVRKRVTRKTPGDSVFTVDAVLKTPAPQQLEAVKVEAAKPTPERDEQTLATKEVGGSEQVAAGVFAALTPDLRGSVLAAANTLPGITPGAGGFSVMGMSPDQNRTTLNGMSFGGASVPRDAPTVMSVATSTYDPARGWFSGGEANVSVSSGILFSHASASVSLDAPPLQSDDALARQLGRQFTDVQLGTGGNGVMFDDKISYGYGVKGTRRTADVATLTNAGADVLQHAGVARDSVARLLQVLSAKGIPLGTSAFSGGSVTQGGSRSPASTRRCTIQRA